MANKKGKLIWAIVITLIVSFVVNIFFSYIVSSLGSQSSSVFALSTLASAINLVITGFSAGLGFYLAKSLVEK